MLIYIVLSNFGRKISASKNFRGDKILDLICVLGHGHLEGGRLGSAKKLKTPYFEDIENSFHEVTCKCPELHQFFLF